ncbi:hypothetical protein [Streptomyces sp. SID13726]|uniref:hypothetical protein n=1 Tax=Streptomyces sp. SID13726 TaxID=2706058 RepID=UPI0013BD6CD6|nr:hypothetical protein [Streptomyces sp. SID13726]NEA98729.1 hypothetical protein [Streptomyces sp. SID13726]
MAPERRAAREARARRSLEFGAAWLIGGVLVAVITHGQFENAGAYVVTWGPMVYGVHRIVAGLRLLIGNRWLP